MRFTPFLCSLVLFSPLTSLGASPARPADATLLGYARKSPGNRDVHSSAPIPSFSRQTGFACNVCHTAFPQLTPFGRDFKLNGYTLLTQQTVEQKDSARTRLRLSLIPPASVMFIASLSSTRRAQPDAQNTNADFPQEMGFFVGGSVTPHLGGFLQATYDPAEGTVAVDNVDLRLANRGTAGSKPFIYGLTLNNNPTVQDAWNTAPAWSYPFTSSAVAPGPAAAAILDGGLGQTVMGLGGYLFWNGLLYGELTGYRSAPQGTPNPPNGDSEWTVEGVTPYWRLALQRSFGRSYFEVGTFGLVARLYPSGVSGSTDRYTDLAVDAQFERPVSNGNLVAHGILIHEEQSLNASFTAGAAANDRNTLTTLRLDATYRSPHQVGITMGVLNISGHPDEALYPSDPLSGSRTGKPDSTGLIGELSWMPWLNTRFGVQYTRWTRFNGARGDYDGSGRAAGDNDTLYIYSWVAF
jgi:hypothetical protein